MLQAELGCFGEPGAAAASGQAPGEGIFPLAEAFVFVRSAFQGVTLFLMLLAVHLCWSRITGISLSISPNPVYSTPWLKLLVSVVIRESC